MVAHQDKNHFPGRIYVQENWGKPKNITKAESLSPAVQPKEFKLPGNAPVLLFSIGIKECIMIRDGIQDVYFLHASVWGTQKMQTPKGEDKNFKYIKFSNGLAAHNGRRPPYILAEFLGYSRAKSNHNVVIGKKRYYVNEGDFVIKIGKVVDAKYFNPTL